MQKIQIIRLTKGDLKGQIEYVIENTDSHFQNVGYAQTYEEALVSINEVLELNKEDFQPLADGCLNKGKRDE